MKTNLQLIVLLSLLLVVPALAATQYKKEVPFEMTGVMTHFYGGPKSAESVMWAEALQVCSDLSKNENNGLLLNRLSKVTFSEANASSIAQATFVCLPAGSAH